MMETSSKSPEIVSRKENINQLQLNKFNTPTVVKLPNDATTLQ
jgi:hypothetical protein